MKPFSKPQKLAGLKNRLNFAALKSLRIYLRVNLILNYKKRAFYLAFLFKFRYYPLTDLSGI